MAIGVSQPEYWNELYLKGEAGWDKGAPAPPIVRMLGEGLIKPGARVAVIGAGKGHEAFAAAKVGFDVTAIDFAAEPVKAMRQAQAPFEVLQADVFELPKAHAGRFHAVIEHTCFCAIDVARRDEYVDTVAAVLAPGGLLFGLFYAHGRKEEGPPFDTTEAELRQRFERRFEIVRLTIASDSIENRAGKELEAVFKLRAPP